MFRRFSAAWLIKRSPGFTGLPLPAGGALNGNRADEHHRFVIQSSGAVAGFGTHGVLFQLRHGYTVNVGTIWSVTSRTRSNNFVRVDRAELTESSPATESRHSIARSIIGPTNALRHWGDKSERVHEPSLRI